MQNMANELDTLRRKCWERAEESYGTAHIFARRANLHRALLRGLTFLGVVVPVVAGSIVLSFGKLALAPGILIPSGILAIVQLVGSVWSLAAKWDDTYSYSLESLTANNRLFEVYQKLAENPPANLDDFKLKFDLLEAEDEFRNAQDLKQGITDKEKRRGKRAGLRQLRRPCPACGITPTSMRPTDCDVCGKFWKGDTMNERTTKVFVGYLELTAEEKAELVKKINEYVGFDIKGRRLIEKDYSRITLGPASPAVCPCCGR
jgi:mobilome CxxCx(11)CxxC protein